jgi:hypothetical protein
MTRRDIGILAYMGMDYGDNLGIKTGKRMNQDHIRFSVYFLPFSRRLFNTGQVGSATAPIRPRDDLGAVDELVAAARQGVGSVLINVVVHRGRLELKGVAPTGEDHASSLTWRSAIRAG